MKRAIQSDINIKMLTDFAPTIIWTRDAGGEVTYLNSFWYEFTGTSQSEIVNQDLTSSHIHPDDLDRALGEWRSAQVERREYRSEARIRRHDGEFRWFAISGRPVFDEEGHLVQWMGVASIIDDLKKSQEETQILKDELERTVAERTLEIEEARAQILQEIAARQTATDALRQAQKMESVGQLTGGIAHDFNNMLTVIIGNLEMTKMNLHYLGDGPAAARIMRQVTMAIEAGIKAEKLTAQLLAFSRKSKLRPERLDPNLVVLGVQDIVQRAVGVKIKVDIDLQKDVWLCLSDKNQLESAILNLAINSRDAMVNGGDICIKTQNRDIDGSRFVSVSVSDTGVGMTQEVKDKVFEPFYTTKDVGKGSGLGLSMVYGFCQQSNGRVYVESEVDRGTTVEMLFPYTAGDSVDVTRREEDFNYDVNKASILVVDDEPGVRELAASVLTDMGYNVLSAEDGNGALELIRDPKIPIDLLFTDVVMPNGLDGFELSRLAQEIRPSLPVIYTTGHAEVALKELKRDHTQKIKVLGKPYRISDLRNMVAGVMGSQKI